MTSVDLGVLGVMFLSGLLAFSRGLVREVLSIGAWLGAAVVAMEFMPKVRPYVVPYLPSPEWGDYAGWILLFLISLIVFTLIAKTIGGMVRTSVIGGIDRTLGLIYGLVRGAGLAIAVYLVASWMVPSEHWPEQVLDAFSLAPICKGAKWVSLRIPEEYRPTAQDRSTGLDKCPPARQTALEPILNTSPSGRAIDPPLRR